MEINDGNLQALAGYMQKTLSPDPVERRGAEKFLEKVEGNQNYLLLLLHLVDKPEVDMHLRVGAAITLKNFVKRNWKVNEDGADKIHASDRMTVKSTIVDLMLKSPEQIQKQLSDAIGYIGHEDFPDKWPNLIPELVLKFQSGDFHVINGVLHTTHSIFKRYRYEFKSEKLWREIKFVLDSFAMPLTQLFNATMELAATHANNRDALKIIYSSLLLISKIFYSLNFQDLPEFFEDNMATWMSQFQFLLSNTNPLLITDDREEPGLMEQVKAQICENITMYAQKYDEEFSSHLPGFVTTVWNLLISTGSDVKFDQLVSSAIQFLASVAERPAYKQLFADSSTLTGICERVIVPNMEFRDADEEAFEDNAEEYMRRDVEGSDVDTRRRAACDLVRALNKSFEGPVIQIFSNYVQHMLTEYSKNPSQNWKSKDAAIFLVTSLAAKAQTQKHGITQTSELVNVVDFFHSHIAPDLQSPDVKESPVLKADAIKYLMVFRSHLPREVLVAALGPLINLLQAPSQVVHSYSAFCIERLLTVKSPSSAGTQGCNSITKAELAVHSEQLLTNLFVALTKEGSQENEYVMKVDSNGRKERPGMPNEICWVLNRFAEWFKRKLVRNAEEDYVCQHLSLSMQPRSNEIESAIVSPLPAIMRTLHVLQEFFVPHVATLITQLTEKLLTVSKNPSKPHFNHFLFESICIVISATCKLNPEAVASFEEGLFPPFQAILQQDVQEFIPYVFQVLALLLEMHAEGSISPPYLALFSHLLQPSLWTRDGNIPPLVRLLQAYISKGIHQVEADKLPGILGVFQKLLASKINDNYGFSLLQSLILHVPRPMLEQYISELFILIFKRLQSSKTPKLVKLLVVFFSLFAVKYGASCLVQVIDKIQNRMFGMIIEKLLIADLQKVSGNTNRKICAVGMTMVLTEVPTLLQQAEYAPLWPKLLEVVIGLFELPRDESVAGEDIPGASPAMNGVDQQSDDSSGFQAAYSQLVHAAKPDVDPCADVPDVKIFLAKSLHKLCSANPNAVRTMIFASLSPEASNFLQQYVHAAGVQLA